MNNSSYICRNKKNKRMKGRPKNIRIISSIPTISGFKPYGGETKLQKQKAIFLNYEEYEAIRLNDYEKNTQIESAKIMGISRPTFTRIYMSAREKIGKAFVEGRRIIIEGGKVKLDDQWRTCEQCGAIFSIVGNEEEDSRCPLCGSKRVEVYSINTNLIPPDSNEENHCSNKRCTRKKYANF